MKVCDVIDAHFKGDLDHVADTLSLLWQTANEVCKTTTTSDNRSSVHPFPIHPDIDADSDSSNSLNASIAPRAATPSRARWGDRFAKGFSLTGSIGFGIQEKGTP